MTYIKLSHIKKDYQDGKKPLHVIRGINMTIHQGDMVSIMGRSGSGKTTLLHILAGLLLPNEGEYYFMDRLLNIQNQDEMRDFRRRNIGYITQEDVLLYDRNVEKNILLPSLFMKYNKKQTKDEVKELADKLNISELLNKKPLNLSGGERQRVAIARALLGKKNMLLADEPTGALDEEAERDVLTVFKRLNSEGMTIVIVTHDKAVSDVCNKHFYLKDGMLQNV